MNLLLVKITTNSTAYQMIENILTISSSKVKHFLLYCWNVCCVQGQPRVRCRISTKKVHILKISFILMFFGSFAKNVNDTTSHDGINISGCVLLCCTAIVMYLFIILYAVYCIDVACQVIRMSLRWSYLVHVTINTLTLTFTLSALVSEFVPNVPNSKLIWKASKTHFDFQPHLNVDNVMVNNIH